MSRLIILIAVAVVAWLALRWFVRTPPQQVIRSLKRGALWGVLVVIIALAMTGRLNWLVAAAAAAVPLLRRAWGWLRFLPAARGLFGQATGSRASAAPRSGQSSTVESRFLRMTLDHDSGDMDGEVLEGAYADRFLSQMTMTELLSLWQECRQQDAESVALLTAYLDRQHPDWRSHASDEEAADRAAPADASMSADEARAILGVESDASETQIIQAHRRLMHKLHPDRGGSDYLASKINLAKDRLLGK
jgi:hypothetical protein